MIDVELSILLIILSVDHVFGIACLYQRSQKR